MASKTLSELVHETNKHVLNASQKPRAKPARAVASVPQPKSYRPAWVDEFNRETTEAELRKQEQNRAMAEAQRLAELERVAIAEQEEIERQLMAREPEKPRNILDWALHRTG